MIGGPKHLAVAGRPIVAIFGAMLVALLQPAQLLAAGPPFPTPTPGVAVYDNAGIFRATTVSAAEATIDGIEQRTGAEIAVYSQRVGQGVTTDQADSQARALMDQWGVGRRGFDDGLVILFDIDPTGCHGQVQLYAGPGFQATFLSNGERQAIYENDMLPLLRSCDLDGALTVALQRVDAAATPAHAQTLEIARITNALIGFGGVLLGLALLARVFLHWFRFGRDPVYLDDPSILMPAPPPDLTPAGGALILDGRSSRHALTTAMLDLASHGEVAFRDESSMFSKKVGVAILAKPPNDPHVALIRRHPLGEAEQYALQTLKDLEQGDDYITPERLLEFGSHAGTFDELLEKTAVEKGWFKDEPHATTRRWLLAGLGLIALAALALFIGFSLPSDGLVVLSLSVATAGVVTALVARAMPSRTVTGAMIFAMLAAYRRTLEKTLAQARSMNQVVESKVLPWLETPDQAAVWGVALGLDRQVQTVIERSFADAREGHVEAGIPWIPAWYVASAGGGGGVGSTSPAAGFGGLAPGLFGGSPMPDFGGMFAAIGSIGNSPSSAGGGGGGFGGGGSGGGGGGAGGGF